MEGAPAAAVAPPDRSEGRGTHALRSIGPFLAGSAMTALATGLGDPVLVVLGVGFAVLTMPLVADLGRRLLVGFVWIAALVGGASLIPAYPANGAGLVVLVIFTTAWVVTMARRARWPHSMPQILPDVLVVGVGAALALVVLALPLWGRGPELVLLDSTTRYDNLPHFSAMSGLLDGDPRRPGYNYGFHLLGALVVGAREAGPSSMSGLSISEYAFVGLGTLTMCALVLGLLAVAASRSLASAAGLDASRAGRAVSVAFLIAAPLTGLLGAFYVLGHVSFFWAVVAVSAASWLALDSGPSSRRAIGFVLLGAVAAFSIYRSTQTGLAAPAAVVTKMALDRHTALAPVWRWVGALAAGAVTFAGWVPFHYKDPAAMSVLFQASISSGPAVAAPPATTVLVLALLLSLSYAVVRRYGTDRLVGRMLAPLAGFAAFAAAFAVLVVRDGGQLDNYYIWKSALALYISGIPGLLACSVVAFTHVSGRRRVASWTAPVPVVVSTAALVLLPHLSLGLAAEPSGLAILNSRMDHLDAAPPGGAGVVRASSVVGDEPGAFLVLPPDIWGRDRRDTATSWLNALRADPNARSAIPSPGACAVGDTWSEVEACIRRWKQQSPEIPLTIVDLGERMPGGSAVGLQRGVGVAEVPVS